MLNEEMQYPSVDISEFGQSLFNFTGDKVKPARLWGKSKFALNHAPQPPPPQPPGGIGWPQAALSGLEPLEATFGVRSEILTIFPSFSSKTYFPVFDFVAMALL